jgi:mono/diheme cytochrome c family protein
MRMAMTATAIVVALAIVPAMAQEPGDARRGESLAREVCLACHAVSKGQSSSDPRAPAFEAIADTRGMSAMALNVALLSPHRDMPNLALSADERADVIAYILALRSR